jgi:hypothetical protein
MGMRAVKDPPFRRLRIYAFDPSASTDLATAVLNEAVVKLPWEGELEPGPCGEYVEVLDVDPASQAVYEPVDLNAIHLLAQDGFPPSEGNPGFHQQMVYAVAMMTIRNFERALGRRVFWSARYDAAEPAAERSKFVRRLRIYPHALREANAYYSPNKKALLFGYFPASRERPGRTLPGGTVFTCLSNDIVAHETTHAILDGLHRRYLEPSNPDVLAFHEAFADIVALFQHFTMPEAVRHQITRMRGNLGQRSLLSDLARQFGEAIGHYGALRSAIGEVDKATGEPDPTLINRTFEPHARGAILVAAVFDAFLAIYHSRISDLLRLATGNGSLFPDEDLHPDLAARLTIEANKAASHVLRMCMRALDYLPPVDVTFGEYLRAVVTADADLVADDDRGYRIAMIEAFRRRGIFPSDCRSLAADSLIWGDPQRPIVVDWLDRLDLTHKSDREALWDQGRRNAAIMWGWLNSLRSRDGVTEDQLREMGLCLSPAAPKTVRRSRGRPTVEVHSVRPALRTGPNGEQLMQLVVEITQVRKGYADPDDQEAYDSGRKPVPDAADFLFRGGCTLIVDMRSRAVLYCIRKRIDSNRRLEDQRSFLFGSEQESLAATYLGTRRRQEPLAFLHRCC